MAEVIAVRVEAREPVVCHWTFQVRYLIEFSAWEFGAHVAETIEVRAVRADNPSAQIETLVYRQQVPHKLPDKPTARFDCPLRGNIAVEQRTCELPIPARIADLVRPRLRPHRLDHEHVDSISLHQRLLDAWRRCAGGSADNLAIQVRVTLQPKVLDSTDSGWVGC